MPDVARPCLVEDLRFEVGAVHRRGKRFRDVENGPLLTAADVEHAALRAGTLQGQQERIRHILDVDEVAPLPPVLEQDRRAAVEET